MGWLFHPVPRAQDHDVAAEIDRIFTPAEPDKVSFEILMKSQRGSTWYVACRTTNFETQKSEVWACVILTKSYYENGTRWWGYKDVEETMGPYQTDAPKSLIKLLSPTTNEYALKWREACLNKPKPKNLTRFRLPNPVGFTFSYGRREAQEFEKVTLHGRRGVYKCLDLPGEPLVRLTKGDMVNAVAL